METERIYGIEQFDTYKTANGAFRFGSIWLMVPPLAIQFSDIKGEQISWTMRQQSPNYRKTGRGLASFNIDLVFSGWYAIEKQLAPILAMIRRNPIQSVYNKTLQKLVYYEQDSDIPIMVTGYHISTMTDLPDTLMLRINCMVFNHAPYVREMTYLNAVFEGVDEHKRPILNIKPVASPEKSNLFIDFYSDIIKPWNYVGDFMFAGEGLDSELSPGWFSGRYTHNNRLQVLQNGKCIRLPDRAGNYVGSNMTIGYHTWGVSVALDTRLGGYRSNRTGRWIWTEKEARLDILEWLNKTNSQEATKSFHKLVEDNETALLNLPASNVGGKYVKKFQIFTDSSKQILQQSVQRQIPASVLPIASSHVPTVQYLGGAESSVTVTIATQSEEWLEALKGVDSAIESAARSVHKKWGWDLVYLESDIPNLNGTFNISWGNIDIQTVEDNPGTYIVNITMKEQGDVLRILDRPPQGEKDLKRKLIALILDAYSNWEYSQSVDSHTHRYIYGGTGRSRDVSYVRAVIIPLMLKTCRDKFIDEFKDEFKNNKGLMFQNSPLWPSYVGFYQSDTQHEAASRSVVMNDPLKAAIVALTDPASVVKHMVESGLHAADAFFTNNNSNAGIPSEYMRVSNSYNSIWRAMTGKVADTKNTAIYGAINFEDTGLKVAANTFNGNNFYIFTKQDSGTYYSNEILKTGDGVSEEEYFRGFRQWLRSKGKSARNGAVEVLMQTFQHRLDYLMRCPLLLEWELNLMYKKASSPTHRANAIMLRKALCPTEDPSSIEFQVEKYFTNYPDMGVPYEYWPKDSTGKKLSSFPHTFLSPTFYIQKSSRVSPTSLADDEGLASKEKQSERITDITSKVSKELGSSTHTYGSAMPNATASTESLRAIGYLTPELVTPQAKSNNGNKKEEKKRREELEKQLINNNIKFGTTNLQLIGNGDLVDYNETLPQAVANSNETSRQAVTEHLREGRLWRATFKDYNPSIEADLSNIIEAGYNSVYNNDQYYNLDRAFPTYKLYFRVENKPEWFLFDQYFDFKGADSIKVYRDKASPGAVMHLVLNNYNNCLTDLAVLRAQRSLKPEDINSNDAILTTATPAETPIAGVKLSNGTVKRAGDLATKAIKGNTPQTQTDTEYLKEEQKVPIRKLFLRAGTQVQLRLGYSPSSGSLPIVFNGYISDVDMSDNQVVVVGHSYGAELLTDASVGWLFGTVMPPKTLIWKVLMNPNIKHLGKFLGASTTPDGTLLGSVEANAFDDNIYINELTQQGFQAALQAYSTENMTTWDVLQDIAAAHPGYICTTVPYDDRETIFFGRPDAMYQYTHDLGASKPISGSAKTSQASERTYTNKNTENINQLQWLYVRNELEQRLDQKILDRCIDLYTNKKYTEIDRYLYFYATEYCKYIEILLGLASDPASGNIERFLGTLNTGEPASVKEAGMSPISQAKMHYHMHNFETLKLTNENVVYQDYIPLSKLYASPVARFTEAKVFFEDQSKADILQEKLVEDTARSIEKPEGMYKVAADIQRFYGIDSLYVAIAWFNVAKAIRDIASRLDTLEGRGNRADLVLIDDPHMAGKSLGSILNLTPEDWKSIDPKRLITTHLKTHAKLRQIIMDKLAFAGTDDQAALIRCSQAPNKKHFREYHLINSYEHIVNNQIKTSFSNMWNKVRLKYERHNPTLTNIYLPAFIKLDLPIVLPFTASNTDFTIKAGNTLANEITRELTTTAQNVKTITQARNMSTSILAEGIRNMYAGQVVILGDPSIKQYDIVYLFDDNTNMMGPIEVKSVTHLMSAETGFITIIEPHAMVEPLGVALSPTAIVETLFDVASLIPIFALLRPVKAVKGLGWLAKLGPKLAFSPSQTLKEGLPKVWTKARTFADEIFKTTKALKNKEVAGVAKSISKLNKSNILGNTKSDSYAKALGFSSEKKLKRELVDRNVLEGTHGMPTRGMAMDDKVLQTLYKRISPEKLNSALEDIYAQAANHTSKLSDDKIKILDEIGVLLDKNKIVGIGRHAKAMALTLTNQAKKQLGPLAIAGKFKLLMALMIGGTLGTYEFMAGRDDANYACPIKITPLAVNNEPFTAGLEGLNRDGDLLHIVENEVLRFMHSLKTIVSYSKLLATELDFTR
jgi:hypothetical protein